MSSRVNEVNGENLQDPPNQKSWLRQCHTPREFPTVATLKKVSVGGERPFYAAIPDPEVRGRRRDLYFIFSPSAVLSCHSISVAMESSAWECLEDSENCFFQNVRANKFAKKLIYTVSQKKQDTQLLLITSPNICRFSIFFSLTDLVVNLQPIHF